METVFHAHLSTPDSFPFHHYFLSATNLSHQSSPMAPNPSSYPTLTQLPQDQIASILLLLPSDSIISFSMTCRRFRSLAAAGSLWESVCRRDWGGSCVDALITAYNERALDWKRLYREISQLSTLACRRLPSRDGAGAAPRPRASHSLNFVSDCLVLFGGGCEGGRHLDDTWVAYIGNGFNMKLNWQNVHSGTPSGRFGHSCTVINDSLLLFGGINEHGVRHSDTWIGQVIHESPFETKISWMLLDVGNIMPSPRGAHAACHAGNWRIVIHGGIGLYGLRLSDTWLLDLSDGLKSARWHQVLSSKPSPPARSGHSLTWIGGNRMVLFGGRGLGYEVLNDVWLLDMLGEYPEWKELKCDSACEMPLPRVGHSATLILGGKILIYGGEDSHRHRKDDFWVLDVGVSKKMWKKLRAEGCSPKSRSFHKAYTDRSGRCIFVFGGMVDGVIHPGEAYGLRFDGELYLMEIVLQL